MTKPIFPILLLLALAPVASAQGRTLQLEAYLHDNPLHLVPERFDAKVGDTLQVHVTNQGASPHTIVFCGDGVNGESTCKDRWAFASLQPAQDGNLTVPIKKAGAFEFYCDIPGHKQGGMRADLVIASDGAEKKSVPAPEAWLVLAAIGAFGIFVRRRS